MKIFIDKSDCKEERPQRKKKSTDDDDSNKDDAIAERKTQKMADNIQKNRLTEIRTVPESFTPLLVDHQQEAGRILIRSRALPARIKANKFAMLKPNV